MRATDSCCRTSHRSCFRSRGGGGTNTSNWESSTRPAGAVPVPRRARPVGGTGSILGLTSSFFSVLRTTTSDVSILHVYRTAGVVRPVSRRVLFQKELDEKLDPLLLPLMSGAFQFLVDFFWRDGFRCPFQVVRAPAVLPRRELHNSNSRPIPPKISGRCIVTRIGASRCTWST